MRLIAIDGPPGTGKTTTIIRDAGKWSSRSAVVTYTRDAAGVLEQRAPGIQSGTIYSLTWPYVRAYTKGVTRGFRSAGGYRERRVAHLMDPALEQYVQDAPSRQKQTLDKDLALVLHAWDGDGKPPFDLDDASPKGELRYLLPLARWVADGCPMPEEQKLETIAIDEAQDMSALEIRGALGLLQEGGMAYAYGDPGQAIFAHSKGVAHGAIPPAFVDADEVRLLDKGWRVGDPVASMAAAVLRSYWSRPASAFAAEHKTIVMPWDEYSRPNRGLVLGYSRTVVAKAFRSWGLTQTAIVPSVAKSASEAVLCTGHAAKGAEADDVYLLPWTRPGMDKLRTRNPDAIRLLYVMMTRARRRLHVPRPIMAEVRSFV